MSGRIPETFIQDLLSRTDIVELIQARLTLKKTGSNYSACCPFHDEKTPSFTVSPTKQFYYCFGCAASGNAIGFLMAYDRMEFPEAIKYLAAQLGVEIPTEAQTTDTQRHQALYQLQEKISHYYQHQLRDSQTVISYLKSRGLTGTIAKEYAIGYALPGWNQLSEQFGTDPKVTTQLRSNGLLITKDNGNTYDRFRNRVMFPIRDIRGRVIGFGGRSLGDDPPKYLNSPETPIFHKSNELYGLYEARKNNRELKRILVVEGYMDVISLAQHGIPYAVATLGTAINVKQIQKLLRYTKALIFCFDGDRAGQQAAWKALTLSLPLLRDGIHLRFLFLPEKEDPDSLVLKQGQVAFEQQLNDATPLAEVFFAELKRRVPLHSMQDKADFAKQASDYLNTMPKGIYQQLLYEQLASSLDMNVADLERLRTNASHPKENLLPSTLQNLSASDQRLRSLTHHAITLLLNQPKLALAAPDLTPLQTVSAAHKTLLIQLIQLFKQRPEMTTGHLLTHWEPPEEAQLIAQLAARELPIPDEGMEHEFLGALERLLDKSTEQSIRQLIEKAKVAKLSMPEKRQLQALLAQKTAKETVE